MRVLFDRPAVVVGLVGLLASFAWMVGTAWAGGAPKEGDTAPAVELPAVMPPDGKVNDALNLKKDFKGKNVVLFFFPKALTGG
jgi:hypothetical protein